MEIKLEGFWSMRTFFSAQFRKTAALTMMWQRNIAVLWFFDLMWVAAPSEFRIPGDCCVGWMMMCWDLGGEFHHVWLKFSDWDWKFKVKLLWALTTWLSIVSWGQSWFIALAVARDPASQLNSNAFRKKKSKRTFAKLVVPVAVTWKTFVVFYFRWRP
jgi:hypothetical protein